MGTLRIRGGRAVTAQQHAPRPGRAGLGLKVEPLGAVRVEETRDPAAPAQDITGVADDSIVAVEFQGGLKLWMRVDAFRKEFASPDRTRGVATSAKDVWEVAPTLGIGGPTRGFTEVVLKGLEVFGVDVGALGAAELARLVDSRLAPSPGLKELSLDGPFAMTDVATKDVPTDRPILVFIHGTASNIEGGYSKFWTPEHQASRDVLRREYGRAFAFEHRTLSEHPIANAIQLIDRLPEGSRLHLVSHSRGGLVGELLCRGMREDGQPPFTFEEIEAIAREKVDPAMVREFSRKLKERGITVERFVRVACPAMGTTLASGKLDRWLSVVSSLVDSIPIADVLLDLLVVVAKQRMKPDAIPGLGAQMPEARFIQVLNAPNVRLKSDLTVIAGDVEASGIWGHVKLFVPDLFFGGDHDLVVNTGSMYGGAARTSGRFLRDEGPDVNHFRYFTNPTSVRALVAGLTAPETSSVAFQPLSEARAKPPAREVREIRAPAGTRPVVFVVPGIMGSHLAVRSERVWLRLAAIFTGGLKKLRIDPLKPAAVTPQALIEDAYGDLVEHLAETHDVRPFPYDWRLTLLENGRRLSVAVEAALTEMGASDQPVRFVAHSMGGLVVRALMAVAPDVWSRVTENPASRFVMLGTPNAGSFEIVRLLVAQATVLKQLAMADITSDRHDLLEVIKRFPGVLQLLPSSAAGGGDLLEPSRWANLAAQAPSKDWDPPIDADLAQASLDLGTVLATQLDATRTVYVAGQADATAVGYVIAKDEDPEDRIQFLATARGDGKVPWETGIPAGIPRWFMAGVEHGDLAATRSAFPAIVELLERGKTALLPTAPPSDRGLAETFPLPREVVPMVPREADIARSALGRAREVARAKVTTQRVRVRVVHGNLAYAHYPVAVGHYSGDTIVSSEAHLDRGLGGRLSQREALGLYPGPLETCAIHINPDRSAFLRGAIVIGLGEAGSLRPGHLESTFARAALEFALAVAEDTTGRFDDPSGGARKARISSVIIGSGMGSLPVRDAIEAILRGVWRANGLLLGTQRTRGVVIDEIEFVELWQDTAIAAMRALKAITAEADLRDAFEVAERMAFVPGGLRRIVPAEEPGWWHRLRIAAESDKRLRFTALTQRARAEVTLLDQQRQLIDGYIRDAIGNGRSGDAARTLFELLIPNPLKDQAPGRERLVLIVDEQSARYPWELLEDQGLSGARLPAKTSRPMSVGAGLLRQFETSTYRERPVMVRENAALVIGNPKTEFPDLPGATAEATAVARGLRAEPHSYFVKDVVEGEGHEIVTALYARAYRLIHLCGHGVHEYAPDDKSPDVKVSGFVLGNGKFLTPAEVEQMRVVPELVFINCCHLGRVDSQLRRDDRPAFAANIAGQFMRLGVRAVVAAGWAVEDGAAKTFAQAFYREMLSGATFGEAVHTARGETYDGHPGVNTWGAYQCYGDPSYRLNTEGLGRRPRGRSELTFVTPAEVVVELENVAARAKTAGKSDVTSLLEHVSKLVTKIKRADRSDWLDRADVSEAIGLALGELGDFDGAVEYLDRAIDADDATLSLRAIEQRANLRARGAAQGAFRAKGSSARRMIQRSIDELVQLGHFGETVERLSLIGSAYKSLACVATGAKRRQALANMAAAYQKAHDRSLSTKRPADANRVGATYPLLNWLLADLLASRLGSKDRLASLSELKSWCDRAEQAALDEDRIEPSYWARTTSGECALLRALAEGTLPTRIDAVFALYAVARDHAASPREFRSILDHVDFICSMLADEATATVSPKKGTSKHRKGKARPGKSSPGGSADLVAARQLHARLVGLV